MNKLASLGAALALGLCATSANAQATRTWVSGTGNDTNACSRTAPCLTFAGALSKTAAGGEIDCLDAGNFGTVTINKAITIDCGAGGGGISIPNGGNGINVAAGTSDKVVLRNMLIQGPFGNNGVRWTAGDRLMLDNVRIAAFPGCGVCVLKGGGGSLNLRNTQISNLTRGIQVITTSGDFRLQVDRSRIDRLTQHGVELLSANMNGSVTNSVIADAAGTALLVSAVAFINADNNIIAGNGNGVNVTALGGSIRISNNAFENNGTAIIFSGGGTVSSDSTNTVIGPAGSVPNGVPIPLF
jgi:nitrous oxidase accessory protein NosD